MLKFLWNSHSVRNNHSKASPVAIPTYKQGDMEDRVDLQIKALAYIFRRCDIEHAKPFSQFIVDPPSSIQSEKLDYLFNLHGFQQLLDRDEHRVLVDWHKNKFRSLCILSEHPKEMDSLPDMVEHFRFVVLGSGATDAEYIETLANSDIYIEHQVGMEVRRRIVKNALELTRGGSSRVLTKSDRAYIIKSYVNKLAIEVQVDRLYRGTLRAKRSNSPSPNSSPSTSPEKKVLKTATSARKLPVIPPPATTPTNGRGLRTVKSNGQLKKRAESPVKQYIEQGPHSQLPQPQVPRLLTKSSNPNFNKIPIPDLPPSPTKSSVKIENPGEECKELMSQARIAVSNRLERERRSLKMLLKEK